MASNQEETPNQEIPPLDDVFLEMDLRTARGHFEARYLEAQLSRFGGNVSKTADFVGIERSALHRKMNSLGVTNAIKEEKAAEKKAEANRKKRTIRKNNKLKVHLNDDLVELIGLKTRIYSLLHSHGITLKDLSEKSELDEKDLYSMFGVGNSNVPKINKSDLEQYSASVNLGILKLIEAGRVTGGHAEMLPEITRLIKEFTTLVPKINDKQKNSKNTKEA